MYVEIDLKIKDHLGQPREFSKGLLSINDPTDCASMVSMVETKSLATRLSTMDVTYAVVNRAIEGFIAVEVLQGGFHGKITAYTTSVQDILVLYDSKEADAMTVDDCGDILQLMRPVVSVHVEDFLIIVFHTGDGKSESIQFTPMVNGRDEGQITVGATKMQGPGRHPRDASCRDLGMVSSNQGSGRRFLSGALHRCPGVVKNEQGSSH